MRKSGLHALALGAAAALAIAGFPGMATSAPPPAPATPRPASRTRDAASSDAPIATFSLAIAVAREVGDAGVAPVQDDAWIAGQLAEVERLFTPLGVRFVPAPAAPIPPAHAHAETRRDRDLFAASLQPGVVNVFVVASLRDVDDPARMRMGVCWSPRGDAAVRYVLLSSIARPSVLAHELGHYFGNPHSKVPNNVMSYEHTPGAAPFFDDAQGRIVQRTARELLARGILRPLPEASR